LLFLIFWTYTFYVWWKNMRDDMIIISLSHNLPSYVWLPQTASIIGGGPQTITRQSIDIRMREWDEKLAILPSLGDGIFLSIISCETYPLPSSQPYYEMRYCRRWDKYWDFYNISSTMSHLIFFQTHFLGVKECVKDMKVMVDRSQLINLTPQ